MKRLTFDYNFSICDKEGSFLSEESFEKYQAKARVGLSRLMDIVNSGDVGFPKLTEQDLEQIKSINKKISNNFNDLVVIGIGGSALGIEAIVEAILPQGYNQLTFTDRKAYPRFWMLDNTDPAMMDTILRYCIPKDTYVVVISKSGNTVETMANFSIIYEWLHKSVQDTKNHISVITDPQNGPLFNFAKKNNYNLLPLGGNVGGRFSALSSVGIFPASLLGVDVEKLLNGAAIINDEIKSGGELVIKISALYMYYMEHGKSINVFMPYSSCLRKFAEWICQLWGESLGKNKDSFGNKISFGTTPVANIGAIDQHSQLQLYLEGPDDKFITFIGVDEYRGDKIVGSVDPAFDYLKGQKMGDLLNAELCATECALFIAGKPSVRINMPQINEYSLGQLFMTFQYVVAIIGLANNINPFDQPAVEDIKKYIYALMGKDGYSDIKAHFCSTYVKLQKFII